MESEINMCTDENPDGVVSKECDNKGSFTNRILNNICVSDEDMHIAWDLYWLKHVGYDEKIHILQMNEKEHSHTFFELHMVLEGVLEYDVEGEVFTVATGEYLLLGPYVSHRLTKFSPIIKKYAVAFRFQMKDDDDNAALINKLMDIKAYKGKYTPSMVSPIEYIISNTDANTAYLPYITRSQLNVFLIALVSNTGINDDIVESISLKENKLDINDEMIYEAVSQYLKDNISRHVTVSEVSKALLISERQLNRRLNRYCGISFRRLQDDIKCSKARELLMTQMSMAQISERIGIGSEFSFNRFFKRVEGMSPGRFREATRSSNYK